jgi:trehalose 6-phosphate phosphatase
MSVLYSPRGVTALHRLAACPAILAFDLDGTLAPLVDDPDAAMVPPATAKRMQDLSRSWPVAVITGREVSDAQSRLGFKPHYLFGNHGAERRGASRCPALSGLLDTCRAHLGDKAAELRAQRIEFEDKGLSLALHYRDAINPDRARLWLDRFIATLGANLRASHGRGVVNITPAAAPAKGDALLEIMRDCRVTHTMVIGDGVNDEDAFAKAPAGSVSVRVGPSEEPTLADFHLPAQWQVDGVLSLLLWMRR